MVNLRTNRTSSPKQQQLVNTNKVLNPPRLEGTKLLCKVNGTVRTPGASLNDVPLTVSKANLAKGDLFVLDLIEDGTKRIVLQVDEVKENQNARTPEIIIDLNIAKTFPIKLYEKYNIHKVSKPEDFELYLVELTLREQYFSRGDMWRFTRKLVNTTVYLKKCFEIFSMRATVYGLWVKNAPYRVSSGYVTKHTKFVFRSLSACCTLFLQMSKEMWDFDLNGDTYYEKAVDGFLSDLFTRWKQFSCQHDVTMTLFSRVFYNASELEDFPEQMRYCITRDYRGRFYEDFYRVIYQNERYDDWLPKLIRIKQVIVEYKDYVLNYHRRRLKDDKVPKATISCAAEGNFLETLNLSSSVFERHYVDRPFDRLGQMSLIITPGGGVFEVDRELANTTKQRVLDNGIGSDLVCLGEQPLFAVPLFKFFNESINVARDYQIPHWMNLSYYHSSTAPSCFKRYTPRLLFDTNRIKKDKLKPIDSSSSIEESFIKVPHLSGEDYDDQVFRTQPKGSVKNPYIDKYASDSARTTDHLKKRHVTMGYVRYPTPCEDDEIKISGGILINHNNGHNPWIDNDSDKELRLILNGSIKDDLALTFHQPSSINHIYNSSYTQQPSIFRQMAQSAETFFTEGHARLHPPPKALFNPFAPADIRIPMTYTRRRWAHTFPIGPNDVPWHFHHLRPNDKTTRKIPVNLFAHAHRVVPGTTKMIRHLLPKHQHSKMGSDLNGTSRPRRVVQSPVRMIEKANNSDDTGDDQVIPSKRRTGSMVDQDSKILQGHKSPIPTTKPLSKKEKPKAILWGPTGVEPWNAGMITGIDWRSLTIPACLPLTFDYVPPMEEINREYKQNSYTLIYMLPPKKKLAVTESGTDGTQDATLRRRKAILDELIDQRLSQGFQMVVMPDFIRKKMEDSITQSGYKSLDIDGLLSVGRIYHTLSLVIGENSTEDSVEIYVQQHKPQHPNPAKCVDYKYRFQAPDSAFYDPAQFKLQPENLEQYPWNSVDNVVCTHGTGDNQLLETMKYWRTRLVLMPASFEYTPKMIESGARRCDSRAELTPEQFYQYIEHFIRFLHMLNKLKYLAQERVYRPLDPVTGKKKIDLSKRSNKPVQTFSAEQILNGDLSSLPTQAFKSLPFVSDLNARVLPDYSFISVEAVWWCIEHCTDIENEQMALKFLQTLFTKGVIRHCTGQEKEYYRFGFFLYYIVTERTKDFRLEANDYAEVEFFKVHEYIPSMDFEAFRDRKSMRLLPKIIGDDSKPKPSIQSNFHSEQQPNHVLQSAQLSSLSRNNENMIRIGSSTVSPPLPDLRRNCNVDVDPFNKSDRTEWATAHYHSYYNPHCLFELEIRWLVATACILSDLINSWAARTKTGIGEAQVAFHLVPVPCDPFAEFDALRGPIYIRLNVECLKERLSDLAETDQIVKLSIFQELILKRYGFILNACVCNKSDSIYCVHISGGMLVYIISDVYNVHKIPSRLVSIAETVPDDTNKKLDIGFYWCWNFCLGKRWRTTSTGDERYQDTMLADFRSFCRNENNRMVLFWDEACERAAQLKATESSP